MENRKANSVPPGEAILVIIATFFIFLFVSAATQLTIGNAPTLVIGELLILVVPLVYLIAKGVDIRRFSKIDTNPKYVLLGLACGGLLLLLNIVVSATLTAIFGESQAVQESNQIISSLSSSSVGLTAVITSLGLAGICEEFAFRGFLQKTFFDSLKTTKSSNFAFAIAVLISAGTFGIFHFDPQGVYTIAAFISGLVLGYIFHRWNYTTSATAHASMNLIVLAFLLLGV